MIKSTKDLEREQEFEKLKIDATYSIRTQNIAAQQFSLAEFSGLMDKAYSNVNDLDKAGATFSVTIADLVGDEHTGAFTQMDIEVYIPKTDEERWAEIKNDPAVADYKRLRDQFETKD